MKNLILIIILFFNTNETSSSIYNLTFNDINGNHIDLSTFRGKYILFVNVASECGFTRQYGSLEELYQKYKDKLVIIASPCNQFGGQEPGAAKDIKQFCSKNYDISFLLTEKIRVKERVSIIFTAG